MLKIIPIIARSDSLIRNAMDNRFNASLEAHVRPGFKAEQIVNAVV
ncbi:MAG: hypothetical protein WAQ99_02450 [Pyrinomonadaceae bacterium]